MSNLSYRKQRRENLRQLAEQCLKHGFRVFIRPDDTVFKFPSYFYYSDGQSMAYIQLNSFFGIDVSTVRKPSQKHGTGTSIKREYTEEITKKDFQDFLNISGRDIHTTEKSRFQNLEDWKYYQQNKNGSFGRQYIEIDLESIEEYKPEPEPEPEKVK